MPVARPRAASRSKAIRAGLVLASLLVLAPQWAAAGSDYDSCIGDYWGTARRAGVSRATFDAAFRDRAPDLDTLRLMRRQAEFVKPIWEYLDTAVSDTRVATGKQKLHQYADVLAAIEKRYGVDKEIVLAVWGMETNYGGNMGQHNAIRTLSTLACMAPSRRRYWRGELTTALKILQDGDVAPSRMESSWAGAMGHTQFMPGSWRTYAVDFDGDGKRDIWTDVPDALASTANYLARHGWRHGETWGYEVSLPRGFDDGLAGRRTWSVAEWERRGVRRANGAAFPRPGDKARLLLPAGSHGPAFLMLPNFDVIKRYNNADAYALAVGHLADRILGGGDFVASWPRDERPLSHDQLRELQSLLSRRGFSTGGIDGNLGPHTEGAIRAFQKASGTSQDGFASEALLIALRRH